MKKSLNITLSLLISSFLIGCGDTSSDAPQDSKTGNKTSISSSSSSSKNNDVVFDIETDNTYTEEYQDPNLEKLTENFIDFQYPDSKEYAYNLSAYGNILYASDSLNGISVFSNDGELKYINSIDVGTVDRVKVYNNYLYVMLEENTLQIRDLSVDPLNPPLIGEVEGLDTYNKPLNIEVLNNKAYIGYEYRTEIIDITDKTNPKELQAYGTGTFEKSVIDGDLIYTTTYTDLYSLNTLSDNISSIDLYSGDFEEATSPNDDTDVDIAGKYAYIVSGLTGITVVNIEDIQNFYIVSQNLFPELRTAKFINFTEVEVDGNRLYAYDADGESLMIFDITNPKTPVYLDKMEDVRELSDLQVINSELIFLLNHSITKIIVK